MKTASLILAALAAWLAADTPRDAAIKQDLQKLQGTWVVESMEMDGKFMNDERRKKIKLTIEGENFTFDNGHDTHGGLYKIDPSQNPRQLDIVITRGDEKGKVYLVAYKLEDGKMIQCMELSNKHRPDKFDGAKGTGCALEIWTRQK